MRKANQEISPSFPRIGEVIKVQEIKRPAQGSPRRQHQSLDLSPNPLKLIMGFFPFRILSSNLNRMIEQLKNSHRELVAKILDT